MRERADRRLAALVGLLLAVMAFTNDVVLNPPEFVEQGIDTVVDSVNRADRPSPPSKLRPAAE